MNIYKPILVDGVFYTGNILSSKEEALKVVDPRIIDTIEIKWKE